MKIKWGGIYYDLRSWGLGFGIEKDWISWDLPGCEQWSVWFHFGPWEAGFYVYTKKRDN